MPAGNTLFLPHQESKQLELHLPPSVNNSHERRKQDWVTSRVALQKLFSDEGKTVTPEQLTRSGYQTIPSILDFKYSLSHNEAGALVWLIPKSAKLAIGVDIESETRTVNAKIEARIRTQQDDKKLSLISLWSLKEAVYKSVPLSMQTGLKFSEIYCQDGDFFIPILSIKGHWQQEIKNGKVFSYAWSAISEAR